MKKLMFTLLSICLLMGTPVFGADGEITKAEVREDVVKWQLDTVRLLAITKTAEVTYRKVDASDNPVGEEKTVIFQNVTDDVDTPLIDETDNSFTQLIQAINNGSNIKQTITNAVKLKLNIN